LIVWDFPAPIAPAVKTIQGCSFLDDAPTTLFTKESVFAQGRRVLGQKNAIKCRAAAAATTTTHKEAARKTREPI